MHGAAWLCPPVDTAAAAVTAQRAGRSQYTVLARVPTGGRVVFLSNDAGAAGVFTRALRDAPPVSVYLAHWHLKLPPTTLWSGCVHNRCRLGSIVSLIPRGTNW